MVDIAGFTNGSYDQCGVNIFSASQVLGRVDHTPGVLSGMFGKHQKNGCKFKIVGILCHALSRRYFFQELDFSR